MDLASFLPPTGRKLLRSLVNCKGFAMTSRKICAKFEVGPLLPAAICVVLLIAHSRIYSFETGPKELELER